MSFIIKFLDIKKYNAEDFMDSVEIVNKYKIKSNRISNSLKSDRIGLDSSGPKSDLDQIRSDLINES
uniref:Uncharacterized protein n=1 Tax=Rhizophagus irregularis (strain DAOM 181602 / DAOM 197198 / MUCL 43194) TaxID=747089 RepID=U9SP37_RHIID